MTIQELTLSVAGMVVEAYEKDVFTAEEANTLLDAMIPTESATYVSESGDQKIPLRKKIAALAATVGIVHDNWKTDRNVMLQADAATNKEIYAINKDYKKRAKQLNNENKKDLENLRKIAEDPNSSVSDIANEYRDYGDRYKERKKQGSDLQKEVQDRIKNAKHDTKDKAIDELAEKETRERRKKLADKLLGFNKSPRAVANLLKQEIEDDQKTRNKYDQARQRNDERHH